MNTTTKHKTEYTYKLFRVKHHDGKSTTVSVDPALVAAAVRSLGDQRSVAQIVREASLRYNPDKAECSRSRFVQRQLILRIQGQSA